MGYSVNASTAFTISKSQNKGVMTWQDPVNIRYRHNVLISCTLCFFCFVDLFLCIEDGRRGSPKSDTLSVQGP